MKTIDNIISQNISSFLIKEGIESQWVNIGIIKDGCPYANGGDLYLMADMNYNNNYLYKRAMESDWIPENQRKMVALKDCTKFTEDPNREGKALTPSGYKLDDLIIYDEYRDTEFGDVFLGKRKTEADARNHEEFMLQLNYDSEGNVILQHDSNEQITDGVVRYSAKKQNYSNNSDIGVYFWGSYNKGNDPSNSGSYTYYCKVNPNDIYDFENNMERIISLKNALGKYKYVAQYWGDKSSIVVNTVAKTPILYILDKKNGVRYDAEWNIID